MTEERYTVQEVRKMGSREKEEFLKEIEKKGHDNEVLYWGCSQAALSAIQQYLDLGDGEAFKAATAFAGGVARTREVCGGLLGAVMAISLAYGRTKYEPGKIAQEQPDYVEALVRASKLCDRFKEKFGSLRCDDVRISVGRVAKGDNRYNTPESLEDHAKCGNVTGPTARFAVETILEPTELFWPEINARLEDMKQARKQQKKS